MSTSENKAYLKILKARPNYICYTSCLGAVIAMTEMLKAAAHENIRIGKGKNTGLIVLLGPQHMIPIHD